MIERIHDIYRPADERVRDFNEVEVRLAPEQIREQMLRCHNCGVPFCHGAGCPLGNVIPDFNSAAAHPLRDQFLPRVHLPHLPGPVRGSLLQWRQ